jgi:hypothetical protein
MTESTPPFQPQAPIRYAESGPPRPGNGAAIASFVFGLLLCIPLLSGLLAIFLGAIGIRKARDPAVPYKGLAIAGFILGFVSFIGWCGVGGVLGYGYQESKKAAPVAEQFLKDASFGNVAAAAANSAGVNSTQLQAFATQMSQFGALQNVSFNSFHINAVNSEASIELGGTVTFATG